MLTQKDALCSRLQDRNLLICVLDAARYDEFEKLSSWSHDKLKKAVSAGSTTTEWAANTFTDFYPNVVYISSVPYISAMVATEEQKKFIGLEHFPVINDVWYWGFDEDVKTVLPEVVAHVTLNALKSYPDKVIIAHFIQPHCPYIGEPPFLIEHWESITGEKAGPRFPKLKTVAEKGYLNYLKQAYEGNLKRVIDSVTHLTEHFDRVIVTSDHGEGFGENGVYGHGEGIRTPELLEVPYLDLT